MSLALNSSISNDQWMIYNAGSIEMNTIHRVSMRKLYQKLLLQTRVDQNLKPSIDAALFTDQNEMFSISKDMREGSQNFKFQMGLNYRKPQNY